MSQGKQETCIPKEKWRQREAERQTISRKNIHKKITGRENDRKRKTGSQACEPAE